MGGKLSFSCQFRLFFMQKIVLFLFAAVCFCGATHADPLMTRLENLRPELLRQPVPEWRFAEGDITNAVQPDFDDSSWRVVSPRFSWRSETNKVWFRTKITIPAEVAGQSTMGLPIQLELDLSNHCEIYVNGELRDDFRGGAGEWLLTEHAQPGPGVFRGATGGRAAS